MRGDVLSDGERDALAAPHKILARSHLRIVQVSKSRAAGLDDGENLLQVAQVGLDCFERREQLRQQKLALIVSYRLAPSGLAPLRVLPFGRGDCFAHLGAHGVERVLARDHDGCVEAASACARLGAYTRLKKKLERQRRARPTQVVQVCFSLL